MQAVGDPSSQIAAAAQYDKIIRKEHLQIIEVAYQTGKCETAKVPASCWLLVWPTM
jgi:hypothetical protein